MSVWAQPLISIELAGREHYAIADYPTFWLINLALSVVQVRLGENWWSEVDTSVI
jgi:hypothetical protein